MYIIDKNYIHKKSMEILNSQNYHLMQTNKLINKLINTYINKYINKYIYYFVISLDEKDFCFSLTG